MMLRFCLRLFAALALLTNVVAADNSDLITLQQEAIRSAAANVADSVVQIETLGGLEKVDRLLVGTGPTTGLVVSEDGYIVSSAFNFIQQPTSILVTLADGKRRAAEVVARDRSRMLVLLKVEAESSLSVPVAAPTDTVSVGETAIALGKTFSPTNVNLSVGIVSAKNRIWGKALQTDAKVSPVNYGGPLVDLQGRVLGVLVPLSPESDEEVAGAEWYDSGIGFAVPLTDILAQLPKWKAGDDLLPGKLGIAIKNPQDLDPPAEVGVVKSRSPAAAAGLKPGDVVVAIDGTSIERFSHMRHALLPRYAGESVTITIRRHGETLERTVELVAEIPPYEHAFLGILAKKQASVARATAEPAAEGDGTRDKDAAEGADDSQPSADVTNDADASDDTAADGAMAKDADGVVVRYVFPESPAAQLGLKPGDRIVKLNDQLLEDTDQMRVALANFSPRAEVTLEWHREDNILSSAVVLGELPTAIPADVPAPETRKTPETFATGNQKMEFPAETNECPMYVPSSINESLSPGLLVLLAAPGKLDMDALLAEWKSVCEAQHLVLIAPRPASEERWVPMENRVVRQAISQAIDRYQIDPQRVVVVGSDAGAAMAGLVTLRNREIIRGLVLHDAAVPAMRRSLENEPLQRLALLMLVPPLADSTVDMKEDAKAMRELGFPVTERTESSKLGSWDAETRDAIGRWSAILGRL